MNRTTLITMALYYINKAMSVLAFIVMLHLIADGLEGGTNIKWITTLALCFLSVFLWRFANVIKKND